MTNEENIEIWVDIVKEQFIFSGYLHHMLYRVLYRQQNLLIGSKIQIKLVEDLFTRLRSPFSFQSLKSNFVFHLKYVLFRRSDNKEKLANDEKYIETLTKSVIDQKDGLYSKLGLKKDILIRELQPIVHKWIKTSPDDYKKLDAMIQEKLYDQFPQIRKITHPEKKLAMKTHNEFQQMLNFMYSDIERQVTLQKLQLELWEKENNKNYLKLIQKQYLYQDLLFLKKQQDFSYKTAFIDMIITFEEWLTFYIIYIVQQDPQRFLNSNGLSKQPWLKKSMEKLESEFKIFKTDEKKRSEIVSKLINREIKNIGYAGSQLRHYIEKHANFKISLEPRDESFQFYEQLRYLRNDLVHPKTITKSKISLPKSIEDFKTLIDKLDQFGELIVNICLIDSVKIDEYLLKKIDF